MRHTKQCITLTSRTILFGSLALALSACSSGKNIDAEGGAYDMLNAATGPLEDLNLKRDDIPPLLKKIADNPYAAPAKLECKPIREELSELDVLLGPDVKAREVEFASNDARFMGPVQDLEMPTTDQAVEGGGHIVHDALVGVIRSQTSILPFRSVIRRLTGADRHQKRLEEAYQAGKLRRAYLKGLIEIKYGKRCLKEPLPVAEAKTPDKL